MTVPFRILIVAFGIFSAWCVGAVQPPYNYSDKTVAELLVLLGNKDHKVRYCAAIFLGERYRNPKTSVINGPIQKPNSPAPEFPIPADVVPRLAEHLKSDADWDVRAGAVFALRDVRFHTNTTSLLAAGLDDRDALIRIRTCTALIDISHEYPEPLVERVIPTLAQCLSPDGEVEHIWQAAYAAEGLGGEGKPLIPALVRLKKHESEKVRHYAESALSKIESSSTEKIKP
jgi:HEAT repeat protein